MKHSFAFIAKSMAIVLSAFTFACSGNNDKADKAANATTANTDGATLPNIRYIDADTISAHYNLAKDFQEAALKTYSKLENAQQSKAGEIQRFGQKIEERMRSNYYVGKEQEYESDMRTLNKMQQDAESYMANLQRTSQQELAAQQQELNDSLESFIQEFNKKAGYDAILYKAAGVYFSPALDITNEVIEGLNARYNKVDKKK